MTCKLLLADATLRCRDRFKLDISNAYMQGVKQEGRPVTYMAMPTYVQDERGEDGSKLCIQLETPCWGEQEAGFEWQV